MLVTKKYFLSFMIFGLLSVFTIHGQKPVDVVESTVKIGVMSEELIYYGFAEGDQLIFSFEEVNGKELKEFEIVEMPYSSKFKDIKTKKVENKIITVPRTGIYKFRFSNFTILPRVCKYKIQRIPAGPATQNFNTTVYFDTYNDTTYTTEVETYIDKSDTIINNFQDRNIKVNPPSAPGTSKANFNFVLPENAVAWSYYITTEKAGQQLYQEAAKTLTSGSVPVIEKFPKYGPLAAVALDRPSFLTKLDSGMRINFWIVEGDNAELFMRGEQFRFIKKGTAINDFYRMEPRERAFNFCFHNDNKDTPVTVTVKITTIAINETLASHEVKKMQVTPKKGMHLKN